jgi:uncharacterized coiled-coil DUF342 family protein
MAASQVKSHEDLYVLILAVQEDIMNTLKEFKDEMKEFRDETKASFIDLKQKVDAIENNMIAMKTNAFQLTDDQDEMSRRLDDEVAAVKKDSTKLYVRVSCPIH